MQKPMAVGDVRVIGLVAGTHVIEDINRDVPHGETITISAEQAFRSKDLWRGISQRCLMQLPLIAATPAQLPQQTQQQDMAKLRLEQQVQNLEQQVRTLTAENIGLRSELARGAQDQTQKLDTILAALQNGVPMAASMVGGGVSRIAVVKEEVADGTAPTFLPSQIKPQDVNVRIDIQGEDAPSDMADAADRLRRLRKGGAA